MYLLNDSSGLDTSGRDSIYGTVLIGIGKNFFTGIGLMNDRNLLGGLYTHNLILEILLSFGVFFGGVILLAIFYLIFKAYQKTKNTDLFPYMCIFFSCTIVKLMISGSFIAEPLLYMFFGFCVSSIRRSRLKDTEHSLQKGFGGKSYV